MPSFTITNHKKQEFVVLYDEEDTELIAQYTWYVGHGYAATMDRHKDGSVYLLYMHRRIMEAPERMIVDHINGDPLDNRKENLRFCTHSENMRNRKLNNNNTSGYKGVALDKQTKKFRARIRVNRVLKELGSFQTALEAAHVYNSKAKELFGEFASPNKI